MSVRADFLSPTRSFVTMLTAPMEVEAGSVDAVLLGASAASTDAGATVPRKVRRLVPNLRRDLMMASREQVSTTLPSRDSGPNFQDGSAKENDDTVPNQAPSGQQKKRRMIPSLRRPSNQVVFEESRSATLLTDPDQDLAADAPPTGTVPPPRMVPAHAPAALPGTAPPGGAPVLKQGLNPGCAESCCPPLKFGGPCRPAFHQQVARPVMPAIQRVLDTHALDEHRVAPTPPSLGGSNGPTLQRPSMEPRSDVDGSIIICEYSDDNPDLHLSSAITPYNVTPENSVPQVFHSQDGVPARAGKSGSKTSASVTPSMPVQKSSPLFSSLTPFIKAPSFTSTTPGTFSLHGTVPLRVATSDPLAPGRLVPVPGGLPVMPANVSAGRVILRRSMMVAWRKDLSDVKKFQRDASGVWSSQWAFPGQVAAKALDIMEGDSLELPPWFICHELCGCQIGDCCSVFRATDVMKLRQQMSCRVSILMSEKRGLTFEMGLGQLVRGDLARSFNRATEQWSRTLVHIDDHTSFELCPASYALVFGMTGNAFKKMRSSIQHADEEDPYTVPLACQVPLCA